MVWIHAGFLAVFLLSRLPKMMDPKNLDLQKKKKRIRDGSLNISVDSAFHTAVQQVIYEKCSFKLPLC